jgi:hypothetical protein
MILNPKKLCRRNTLYARIIDATAPSGREPCGASQAAQKWHGTKWHRILDQSGLPQTKKEACLLPLLKVQMYSAGAAKLVWKSLPLAAVRNT